MPWRRLQPCSLIRRLLPPVKAYSPESVRHDVFNIQRRAKAIRRLIKHETKPPTGNQDEPPSEDPSLPLWANVATPLSLRMVLSPSPKNLNTLGVLARPDSLHMGTTTLPAAQGCFKGLRKATRLFIRHARNFHLLKYGKTLLRMFVKKPSVALNSILRTSDGTTDNPTLPTDLSILRDETSRRFLTTPSEVLAQLMEMETTTLSSDPTVPLSAPFSWLGHVRPTPTSSVPMLIGQVTPAIFQEALRRTPNHKDVGPNRVPGVVLKHMPPAFHEALRLLFQTMAITGINPPSWIQSHTILLYIKGDPTRMDNYRPITLANSLYKLWTTFIVILATDYIESRKILSPEQEGFRADRSCDRAITHLGLCVEDAHSHKKDIVLCYLNFKGVFPSTDHIQLVRVLEFLGLPTNFTRLISNLYSGASTEFITPHNHTPPAGIRRGTLQRDPLSPLLFDLVFEPLIRWLTATGKGYDITSCGLKLANKCYADDGTLITNSVEDMISLLDIIKQFSTRSGIHLNAAKCKIGAYIHELQYILRKKTGM